MDPTEYIIDSLEHISMNRLPKEVKLFVQTFDPSAHQYDHQTLTDTHDLAPTRTNNNLCALGILFFLNQSKLNFSNTTSLKLEQYP